MTRPRLDLVPTKGFGDRLRKARVDAGLSLRQLAAAGGSAGYISRAESEARIPTEVMLAAWAKALGVTVTWLATGEGDKAAVDHAARALAQLELTRADLGDIVRIAGDKAGHTGVRADIVKLANSARAHLRTIELALEELGRP